MTAVFNQQCCFHCAGVLAAVAVACSTDLASLIDHSATAVSIAYLVGHHYHRLGGDHSRASAVVHARAAQHGVVPTPMVSVLNVPVRSVRRLVAKVNSGVPAFLCLEEKPQCCGVRVHPKAPPRCAQFICRRGAYNFGKQLDLPGGEQVGGSVLLFCKLP